MFIKQRDLSLVRKQKAKQTKQNKKQKKKQKTLQVTSHKSLLQVICLITKLCHVVPSEKRESK